MLKIGMTGGIGCGKSTACSIFTSLGVPVIDTDILARKAVAAGSKCLSQIAQQFGHEVLQQDGALNRHKLRQIVFSDLDKLRKLESIIHPEIRRLLSAEIESTISPYLIVVIPLLFEKNWNRDVDRILVVDCTEEEQLRRTSERDAMDVDEVKRIMATQISRNERIALADDILDNRLGAAELRIQIEKLHLYYTQLSSQSQL